MKENEKKLNPIGNFDWKRTVLILLVGIGLGWQFNAITMGRSRASSVHILPARKIYDETAQAKEFSFISPLLLCDSTEPRKSLALGPLETMINSFIENQLNINSAVNISVYYRNLNAGRWTGVNENIHYSPASLLKVPTMMALFQNAESRPEILDERIRYDGSFDENQSEYFKPQQIIIKPGAFYTVNELIHAMASYSDNNATRLLFDKIRRNSLDNVYSDLGVELPNDEDASITDFINVKMYARFFRVLYNATYLGDEYSNKALSFLSEPDFPQGLRGGVPLSIPVAQKFGERTIINDQPSPSQKELHDCGIVYYPGDHYLLCVMTKGDNFDKLADVIQNISRLTYNWVDTQYKK